MACKLKQELIDTEFEVLEEQYSGKELEAMKSLALEYINSVYDADSKTVHLNENYYKPGDKIRVSDKSSGKLKSYPIEIYSIKYNPNGEVETVSKKKDGSEGAVFITKNGYAKNGAYIDALNGIDEKILSELGSSEEFLSYANDREFEKLEEGILNDPKKANDLLEDLILLDNVDISDSHKERLRTVLSTFTDSVSDFIPKMNVYLNTIAEKNGGFIKFSGPDKGLRIGVSSLNNQYAGNQMSAAEAYVHEVIHAATEFARVNKSAEVASVMRRIRGLHEQAIRHLTVEDLMPEFSLFDRNEERKIAENMLKYIKSENGLSEFIALGLTNEKVIAKLNSLKVYEKTTYAGKTFFEKLLTLIGSLYEKVMRIKRFENGEISNQELLLKLSLRLAEANNGAIKRSKYRAMGVLSGPIDKVGGIIDKVNNYASMTFKRYERYIENQPFERLQPGYGKLKRGYWFLKNAWRLMNDSKTRPYFESVLSSVGFKPENTLQTVLRGFRDLDNLQRMLEKIGLASGKIDRIRENYSKDVGNMILQGFINKPTKKEQESMTIALLDTDISSIQEYYSISEISNLLKDSGYVQNQINYTRKELESLVNNKAHSNYFISQSAGLGYYIATHKGEPHQLLNSDNIASRLNTDEVIDADPSVVKLIDKLATLEALKYTPEDPKNSMSALIEKDEIGVRNFLAYHKYFKEESDKYLFQGDTKINKIKGYSKEIFDQDVTVKIAPLSDADSLYEDGFELVEKLIKDPNDNTEQELAIFVNRDHATQSFNRVGMRLTDQGRRGTSLKDVRRISGDLLGRRQANLDIRIVNAKVRRDIKALENGIVEPESRGSYKTLLPVFDEFGIATDYRYMMSKSTKAKLLNQDFRGPLVLGRMHAGIKDKVLTKDFNEGVVDVIFDDMEMNYTGEKFGLNGKEYVIIDASSNEKDIRELYSILPKTVKDSIIKRRGVIAQNEIDALMKGLPDSSTPGMDYFRATGKIAVRRDLMYSYFGFRDMSITDNKFLGHSPVIVKRVVRVSEMVWKEVVKIAKVGIIIKTPAVLASNIVSNFVLSAQLGMSIGDIFKMQLDGLNELKSYNNWSKELNELESAKLSGNIMQKNIDRIETLKGYMRDSSVRDLMDEGLFSAIVEDANVDDLKTSSKFVRKIDEKLENAPAFVRNGLHYLYVTERTLPFKLMTTATQYSDFVARYALYHALLKKGASKEVALAKVTDAFINYGSPDSKLIQYLNDIGLVMFTKYFLRIQRVIRTGLADHPVNFLLALLAQEFVVGDWDDVTEQSIFTKNYSGVVHNPFDIILETITPSSLEILNDVYKKL